MAESSMIDTINRDNDRALKEIGKLIKIMRDGKLFLGQSHSTN